MIEKRIHILLLAILTLISCSSPNQTYVRDAIQHMDRKGLYAEGEAWEAAKKDALSQDPETLEEAQAIINKAAKVAGGKHSYLLPADKVTHLEELLKQQQNGHTLAYVGDGINDAPALSLADVGIAIGAGTEVAIDCADLVLSSNSLCSVATAVSLSKATIVSIKENLFWALIYNAICIPVAAGALYPFGW